MQKVLQKTPAYNCYVFMADGERLILGLGLRYKEAEARCITEADCLPLLERYGDGWYAEGSIVRLCIYEQSTDPYDNRGVRRVADVLLENLEYV